RRAVPGFVHRDDLFAEDVQNEKELFPVSAFRNNSARLYVFAQPRLADLGARVRQLVLEARARADQTLKTARGAGGQTEFVSFELFIKRVPAAAAISLELRDLLRRLAKSEAFLGDLANLSEIAVGVEKIQKRRIGRAKLALQRIGFRPQKRGDARRILKLPRREHYKADVVFSATPGAPGHLLQL